MLTRAINAALLAVSLSVLGAMPALSQSKTVSGALPGAEVRGAATFRFLGLPLYKAKLFTIGGAPLDWGKDFAIELTYQRNLSQNDLVEGTLRELKRIGGALPIEAKLQACFKAVAKGDRYLAISAGQNAIGFWRNGKRTCTLKHANIKSRFMGIFVGPNTRSKSFTNALKGS